VSDTQPQDHCGIRIDDQPCPADPRYLVVFGNCEVCRVRGRFLYCPGHPACVACTAMIRTNEYEFYATDLADVDAVPVRVRLLAGAQ
jgi:hypothetical protein